MNSCVRDAVKHSAAAFSSAVKTIFATRREASASTSRLTNWSFSGNICASVGSLTTRLTITKQQLQQVDRVSWHKGASQPSTWLFNRIRQVVPVCCKHVVVPQMWGIETYSIRVLVFASFTLSLLRRQQRCFSMGVLQNISWVCRSPKFMGVLFGWTYIHIYINN